MIFRVTFNSILLILLLAVTTTAVDAPHGSANNIYCEQCHITHSTLGEIMVNSPDSLISTLCLSCHTPGGWPGMTKVMSSSMAGDPGVSGVSHAWDVDTLSVDHGAEQPASQILRDHISGDGKITCATCHDPHANSVPPFLQMDNSDDALCLDCHRSRDMVTNSVRTYTGNDLSHPVGVALPSADPEFHNPPLDVDGNPQPSDGNTTNDYVFGAGSTLRCTTCHGIHNSDSNSGTVD